MHLQIVTEEAKLIRLNKSLTTTSEQSCERQNQATASHISLCNLFGQQNTHEEDNKVTSLFNERLLHIRIVLGDLKELEEVKGELDKWAQNLIDVQQQQCRTRRSLDLEESILVGFHTKVHENTMASLKIEAELAVLLSKKRC